VAVIAVITAASFFERRLRLCHLVAGDAQDQAAFRQARSHLAMVIVPGS